MESLLIRSASGEGALEFFERTPDDPSRPIERFKVRLTDRELTAVGGVYFCGGEFESHPAPLFARMSARWRGGPDEFVWQALEGELTLRCTQDRVGHVMIRVELRSGPTEGDWAVQATVMAEAGQLQELARQADQFFGRAG
jgi:hypothetical protein